MAQNRPAKQQRVGVGGAHRDPVPFADDFTTVHAREGRLARVGRDSLSVPTARLAQREADETWNSALSWRGSYHFNDKSVALPGHLLCIIPKVGMKNLSFYLPVINEILNEIAVAIYHILWQFIITFRQGYQGDFITF
jgi:hypothetical protein